MERIYLDVETTGLSVDVENGNVDKIIWVCAIKANEKNERLDKFETYVACNIIPKAIQLLTGITQEKVDDAPSIETVIKELKEFVGEGTIVTYHSFFTMTFVNYYAKKRGITFDNSVINLFELAKERLAGKVEGFRLKTVAEYYGLSTDKNDMEILCDLGGILLDR